MVEDLVARRSTTPAPKADAAAASRVNKMSSALPIPPGFKLPF